MSADSNKKSQALSSRIRAIVAGSAGNFVEWFDWYTYAATALYFAPVFFPEGDQTAQLLRAAAVFAVGFLARPIGAWLMGLYSDRVGRKAGLTLSVSMMCLGSMAIAVLPGAATIGTAAPILLMVARIFQGLSLGGEYGASATYMSEVAGKKYRGFWSSFNYVTLIGGQLVALSVLIALQYSLSEAAMEAWGWRIPFVIGAALAIVVFWLRRRMVESEAFTAAKSAGTAALSARKLFQVHPREVLIILALTAGGSLTFYVYTTYMQKFLTNTADFSRIQATQISAAALFVFMLAQPLYGWLSDKIGRRRMLRAAFGIGAVVTWPIMTAIGNATSVTVAFTLILVAMLIQSGYTSINAVVKAELFPTHVRALGVALPYALANAVFGGTAEYVALWFKSVGMESGFFLYASVLLGIAFIAAMLMPDTQLNSQILED